MSLVLVALFGMTASAQTPLIDFHLVGPEGRDGLTRTVIQDARGFIWFAGRGAVKRYDGLGVEHYLIEGGLWDSSTGSWVHAFCVDASRELWAGGQGGLARFDPARNDWIPEDHGDDGAIFDDWVQDLCSDGLGGIWFRTRKTVGRYRKGEGVVQVFEGGFAERSLPLPGRIDGLFAGRSGTVWIAVKGGLLFRARPGEADLERVPFAEDLSEPASPPRVKVVFEDDDGILWLGTEGGLFRYDVDTRRTRRIRARWPARSYDEMNGRVISILKDRSGRLWLGTKKEGLHCLDAESLTVGIYCTGGPNRDRLPCDSIHALYQDRSGAIWAGTLRGTCRFDGRYERFAYYPFQSDSAGLGSEEKWQDVLYAKDGTIWAGTKGGLIHLDRVRNRTIDFAHSEEENLPPCLMDKRFGLVEEGPQGELWIASKDEMIHLFDRERGAFLLSRTVPDIAPDSESSEILGFHCDPAGCIWIGTDSWIQRYDPREDRFATVNLVPRVDGEDVDPLANGVYLHGFYPTARNDGLWILNCRGNLFRFDFRSERIEPKPFRNLPPGLKLRRGVSCVADMEHNGLWVGTDTGLYRFDPDSGTLSRPARGVLNHYILTLLPDQVGRIWAATMWDGLFCFDPATETLLTFTFSGSIKNSQFSTLTCHRAPTGEMFFAMTDGFVAFHPSKLLEAIRTPSIRLLGITTNGEPREIDRSADMPSEPVRLELKHWEDSLSFEFAGIDYNDPDKVEHAYRLLGAGDEWIYCGDLRRADFSNLGRGSYVFEAKVARSDGTWGEPVELVRLNVAAAPWETWWFKGILLIVAGLLFQVGWHWRARRIGEANRLLDIKVRERTAALETAQEALVKGERLAAIGQVTATVSHEIRNPLSTISASVYSIRRILGDDESEMAAPLRRIERNVSRCVRITEDLLDFGRIPRFYPENTEVDTWLARALQSEDLPDDLSVATELNAGVAVRIDRHWVARCLLNLLMNAYEAMKGKSGTFEGAEVTVESRAAGGRLEFLIRDSGPGISEANMKEIFNPLFSTKNFGTGLGLPFVKRVTDQMEGGIEIESEEGKGTIATLWLPLPD